MTSYNIDFDIAAILVYIIVVVSYLLKKHLHNTQYKLFVALTLCSVLTPITDIISVWCIEVQYNWFITVEITTIYYLSKQATTFFFLLYVISQIEMASAMNKIKKMCIFIPFGIVTALILINPFTGWIFSYNNLSYHRGPFRVVTFSVNIIYFIWTISYLLVHKPYFSKSFRYIIYVICCINIVFEGIQYFSSALLLHSLATAISILILMLNQDHYNVDVDAITGFAKKEELEKNCKLLIHNKVPFQIILIRIKDYDLNTTYYGIDTVEKAINLIEKFLFSFSKKGNAYTISNDCLAMIFSGDDTSQNYTLQIYEELKKSWTVNDLEYAFEFYISELFYPLDFTDWETLIASIQYFKTMHRLQHGIVLKSEFSVGNKVRELKIEKAIDNALNNNSFELYYQPICKAKNQDFVTAEALLRLKDPELGKISPEEFIPIAEQSGSIIQIGNWVVNEVCTFIENHNMEELGLEYIELNLSTIQCMQRNFIQTIDEITSRHHIDSKYLCFEITETASNVAPEVFTKNLDTLIKRGYSLALDDFGTGYGNLQRMVSSDFKIIKFDKNMTQQLTTGDDLKKVYKALQKMITAMGSNIVSEGVETKEQYEFVRDAGCGYIQGFYFSKPLPEDKFCAFLKERRERKNENKE